MTHPCSARRRRSVWLQIAWWSCLKVTFLFKLWDGLAVQSFTNLRNILASLIIIVQHLLRTVWKDYFLIGLRKEKISPVLNNLKKGSFDTHSFDHFFYSFKEETAQIISLLFSFYFLNVQTGGWPVRKTTPAAETWAPPSNLPSSPRPSLFRHCKLWFAVKSHQADQMEDERRRKEVRHWPLPARRGREKQKGCREFIRAIYRRKRFILGWTRPWVLEVRPIFHPSCCTPRFEYERDI